MKNKKCLICNILFSPSKNDRPNSWEKRKFCSSKCSNSRKDNKGLFKKGHSGYINSGSFKKGLIPWNWKGDDVGYDALHRWVSNKLGKPTKCEHCGKDGLIKYNIHWSNKSGEYKRDLLDWQRLCAKCHKNYDLCLK